MALIGGSLYNPSMIMAILNGILGVGLTFGLGIKILNLSFLDLTISILVANFALPIALILTLQAERGPQRLKRALNRSLKTWALLFSIYFGILLVFVPFLRSFQSLAILGFPLFLSSAFSLRAFGPAQDYIVRRDQRRSHARTSA